MFSKKRKSSSSSQQQRLFSTLASIEQTDERATQKRKQSHQSSLTQSKAANDQVKLNSVLLELRILMQRCLDGDVGSVDDGSRNEVKMEVDSLMENLLVARRELLGHEMKDEGDDNKDNEDDSDSSGSDDGDVDYAELIQKENGTKDDESSSSNEEDDDDEEDNNNLSTQLQNEYESLRTSWKTILNKHHSNLALHSGMSVNSSKFQSKAVDLSFWDQVKFATSQGGNAGDTTKNTLRKEFDDSKLYQQMLKDFISQSSSGGGGSGGSATGGKRVDPAQEAAERLKRAMRKKNGGERDVDLTTLLLTQEGGASNLPNSTSNSAAASKKADVDRRASKGRKIRYTVHPKLVNFTFPVARPEPMIKEDIWFKSLFGGVGRV